MKTKSMDEPEFERVRDWLAQYGLVVIEQSTYDELEAARMKLLQWKFRAYYMSKGAPPLIGPPCPPHRNWLRAAPKPLELPPGPPPLHIDV